MGENFFDSLMIRASATLRAIAMALAASACLQTTASLAQAKDDPTEAAFPNVIPLELGTSAFATGDSIKITSLRGDRPHLEADGSYLVEGTYTLASVDKALLLFSCTSPSPSGPTPTLPEQEITVARGTGSFSLKHPPCEGLYHVSFYVDGENHSHGGVYFGEKGVPATVLRHTDWPDFSSGAGDTTPHQSSGDPNRAILEYLGQPVPAPGSLDEKYTPTNLFSAFTAFTANAGWHIRKLTVDSSEFPFLVYGVVIGQHHLGRTEVGEIKGYTYGGSVVGRTGEGEGSTYFALNLIPHDQYPVEQVKACDRRLMIRLQMLADAARRSAEGGNLNP
jgi:hypothetical protein